MAEETEAADQVLLLLDGLDQHAAVLFATIEGAMRAPHGRRAAAEAARGLQEALARLEEELARAGLQEVRQQAADATLASLAAAAETRGEASHAAKAALAARAALALRKASAQA